LRKNNIKYPPREPHTRFFIQYAILELQEAIEYALSGAAEELTAIEIFKLLGRHRRMTQADYAGDRSTRSLVDIEDPALRGSALWFAIA
jgi:hypothetical protein